MKTGIQHKNVQWQPEHIGIEMNCIHQVMRASEILAQKAPTEKQKKNTRRQNIYTHSTPKEKSSKCIYAYFGVFRIYTFAFLFRTHLKQRIT